MKEHKAVLIFSGYNQRAVITFLRTLKKQSIAFFIFAKSNDDQILLSEYAQNVVWIRKAIELKLSHILKKIDALKSENNIRVLMIAPSTEYLNRFLLLNRSDFESYGCIIPLIDKELYERISDKRSFSDLCIENGLTVPAEYKDVNIGNLPLVAKPRNYFSKNGKVNIPLLLHSSGDLMSFQESYCADDFYFQEFVKGQSYYLLMYIEKNGTCHSFSQKNLVQQGNGKSIILAKSSEFHLSEEAKPLMNFLKGVNFKGLIMLEVIKNENRYYIIEANPRFWGPSQLLLDSGNNFFELLLFDYGFIESRPKMKEREKGIIYYWSGGFEEDKQNNIDTYFYDESFSADYCEQFFKTQDVYNKPDTLNIYNL